ncbi:MAG: hypothetical protein IKR77_03625, partial [Bacteroidales bacterium]|nr:hypothetical protein [Bacteroidales bacterium]
AFYQLFKDHGFNTIQIEYQLMPGSYYNPHYVSSSPSKAFLDRADSLGLKIILDCPDIYVDRRKDTAYLNNPSFTQYNQANSIIIATEFFKVKKPMANSQQLIANSK